ncbi:hypothetical protein ACSBR2_025885 [Camellia fascicularis]
MATISNPNLNSGLKPSVYLQDKEEVKKVFNCFDAIDNGKISATEFVLVMKALQSNTSEDEVKRMMEELDTDLDGLISLEEFASFCKGGGDTTGVVGDNGGMAGLKDTFELHRGEREKGEKRREREEKEKRWGEGGGREEGGDGGDGRGGRSTVVVVIEAGVDEDVDRS